MTNSAFKITRNYDSVHLINCSLSLYVFASMPRHLGPILVAPRFSVI